MCIHDFVICKNVFLFRVALYLNLLFHNSRAHAHTQHANSKPTDITVKPEVSTMWQIQFRNWVLYSPNPRNLLSLYD